MEATNINTRNTTTTTTGVVETISNEVKPLTATQIKKAEREAENKAKAIEEAKALLKAEAEREAEEQEARNEKARQFREADAKKVGLSAKDKERGVVFEFFKDCENDFEKRKKINDIFINLPSETRIKIISARGKAIESATVANEAFLSLTFQESFKAIKKHIVKATASELDKNVNTELSKSLGLISQYRIIKEVTTNEQFKTFLESFEAQKNHFCIYGFMSFSELIGQIKTPGKFDIKFVKEFEEGKIKDSLSYKLFKSAHNISITQKEDFKNLMQRGKEFNDLLKLHSKSNVDGGLTFDLVNLILSKFVKIKDLKEAQLRAIFNLSYASYEKFELYVLFKSETADFEKESEFDLLEGELKKSLKSRCVVNKIKDTKVNALALYYSDLAAAQKEEQVTAE